MPPGRAPTLWLLPSAIVLGLGGAPAIAACPATPADMGAVSVEATKAFGGSDEEGFRRLHAVLLEQVACLSAAPTEDQAAAVHRVEALYALQQRDHEAGIRALRAMREAAPGSVLPLNVVAKGGKMAGWWKEAQALPSSRVESVVLPTGYSMVVDGRPVPERPMGRAALVVIITADGSVFWSGLLAADAALPELPPIPRQRGPRASVAGQRSRSGKVLFWSAGVSAAAAGGLWAATLVSRGQVNDLAAGIEANKSQNQLGYSPDEALALHNRARNLGYAAEATTGLCLGLVGVGLVVVW